MTTGDHTVPRGAFIPAMLPLGHLRMLDLSRQLPGPFCSMLLADLGVDVLVVAAPGDPMGVGIPLLGRNKRHMTLNLKDDGGREIFRRLAAGADVVLEGFRPGVMARLGLDYPALHDVNPRLIYCSISGYGQDGPYRDRVGHDINYLGYAGVLGGIGAAGGPPVIPSVQIADIGGGGLMAAVGILAAVIARAKTGRGQLVDVAMLDGSVAWNVFHALLHVLTGREPERGRTRLTGHHPCYAVYETRDGRHVTVGALEGHFWATLCRRLGREDFIEHQFAEGPIRDEMFAFFRGAFRARTLAEWLVELGGEDICFGPVNTLGEAFADPQVRHRRMVVEMPSPAGPMTVLGTPIKLSDTPASLRTPPAGFGEHTEAVLADLGFAAAEIVRLRDQGVV
jgi:crotonobetainyl-CoA:carnitine CoA-transferase CaiB-like acyl-CoA transferase